MKIAYFLLMIPSMLLFRKRQVRIYRWPIREPWEKYKVNQGKTR